MDMLHHQAQGEGQEGMYLIHHDPQQAQQQQMSDPNAGVSLGEMAAGTGNEGKPIESDFPQFQSSIQQSQPQQENEPQPET